MIITSVILVYQPIKMTHPLPHHPHAQYPLPYIPPPFLHTHTQMRGTDMTSPHGIPIDLLDRTVIIRTLPYTLTEMVQIIAIRAQVESIAIDEESLAALGELADNTSLRHAVQLLTPAATLAGTNGRDAVVKGDVEEVAGLFHDAKYSAQLLLQHADKYIS